MFCAAAAALYLKHPHLVHADFRREYNVPRNAVGALDAVEFVELLMGLSANSRLVTVYSQKDNPRSNNPQGMYSAAKTHATVASLRRSVAANSKGSFQEVTL